MKHKNYRKKPDVFFHKTSVSISSLRATGEAIYCDMDCLVAMLLAMTQPCFHSRIYFFNIIYFLHLLVKTNPIHNRLFFRFIRIKCIKWCFLSVLFLNFIRFCVSFRLYLRINYTQTMFLSVFINYIAGNFSENPLLRTDKIK